MTLREEKEEDRKEPGSSGPGQEGEGEKMSQAAEPGLGEARRGGG